MQQYSKALAQAKIRGETPGGVSTSGCFFHLPDRSRGPGVGGNFTAGPLTRPFDLDIDRSPPPPCGFGPSALSPHKLTHGPLPQAQFHTPAQAGGGRGYS